MPLLLVVPQTAAESSTYQSLTIKTFELSSVEPTPSRLVIERISSKKEPGHSWYYACENRFLKFDQENGKEYFYSPGECTASLPVGLYLITAMRGMEFFIPPPMRIRVTQSGISAAREDEYQKQKDWRKAYKELEGNKKEISFSLERWIDMKEKHFWSGDSHIHGRYQGDDIFLADEELFKIIVGEDINVANMIIANDLGSPIYDLDMFTGNVHPLSTKNHKMIWNQEMRNNHLGHLVAHNQNALIAPLYSGFLGYPDETSNLPDSDLSEWDVPNADWADKAHDQNPLSMVEYAHPVINLGMNGNDDFAKIIYDIIPDLMEIPIDVALGKIDGIQVLSYPANNVDSIRFWYRLLNTGNNLPASAGTDSLLGSRVGPYLVNPFFSLPPGGLRTYVYIPDAEDLIYEDWVYASKEGKTFVTNGPMITNFNIIHKETDEKETTGGELQLTSKVDEKLSVNFSVESLYPVQKWTIIVNGKPRLSETVNTQNSEKNKNDSTYQFNISREITVDRSSWVAIKLNGSKHDWVFGGNLLAHTSPIYITINGEPRRSPEDAAYMVHRINRDMIYLSIMGYFKPNSNQKRRILELFEKGCQIYEAQQRETLCISANELVKEN